MGRGRVWKRCPCGEQKAGERACPKKHGSWYFAFDRGAGYDPKGIHHGRRQVKQGGFETQRAAQEALRVAQSTARATSSAGTTSERLGVYLAGWLDRQVVAGLRESTLRSYRQHTRAYLEPTLGHYRLTDLSPRAVKDALLGLVSQRSGARLSDATRQRVLATLSSALAEAAREGLIAHNPASRLRLRGGERPKVNPWTTAEVGEFLDYTEGSEFGLLWEFMVASGLRRGEALGVRWRDVDWATHGVWIRQQVAQVPGPCTWCDLHPKISFSKTKTRAGDDRFVELDGATVDLLGEHRRLQAAKAAELCGGHSDHDLVFARFDGLPYRPDHVTHAFERAVATSGVRHVRLHDLRHAAASLMISAGVDIALISKQLGHASIAITVDTYAHLMPGVGRSAVERSMRQVHRRRRAQDVPSGALIDGHV